MIKFEAKPQILKSNLTLQNVQRCFEDVFLCLDPFDYVLVIEGWGYCLLGLQLDV